MTDERDRVLVALEGVPAGRVRLLGEALALGDGSLRRVGSAFVAFADHAEHGFAPLTARIKLGLGLEDVGRDRDLLGRLARSDEPLWRVVAAAAAERVGVGLPVHDDDDDDDPLAAA